MGFPADYRCKTLYAHGHDRNSTGRTNERATFLSSLRSDTLHFQLSRPGSYALSDMVKGAASSRKLVILEKWQVNSAHLWLCKCPDGIDNVHYADGLSCTVNTTPQPPKEDCVHSSAAKIVFPDSLTSETQDTDYHVDTLTTDPLSVAVFHDGQYWIVHKCRISRNVVIRCDTCSARSRHCDHVKRFQEYCKMNNITLDMTSDEQPATDMASAISTKPIPLNYPAHLRQLYLDYETGDK